MRQAGTTHTGCHPLPSVHSFLVSSAASSLSHFLRSYPPRAPLFLLSLSPHAPFPPPTPMQLPNKETLMGRLGREKATSTPTPLPGFEASGARTVSCGSEFTALGESRAPRRPTASQMGVTTTFFYVGRVSVLVGFSCSVCCRTVPLLFLLRVVAPKSLRSGFRGSRWVVTVGTAVRPVLESRQCFVMFLFYSCQQHTVPSVVSPISGDHLAGGATPSSSSLTPHPPSTHPPTPPTPRPVCGSSL